MTQPPYQPGPGKPKRTVWLIVAVVIAAVVIIAAVLAAGGGIFNGRNSTVTVTAPPPPPVTVTAPPPPPPPVTVTITGINLQISYTGVDSGYLGPTSQALYYTNSLSGGQQFTLTITLTSSAVLLTHSVDSITVNTPGFTLDSVSPSLPYSLSPGASVVFTLTLTAPNYNYNGPLTILVTSS